MYRGRGRCRAACWVAGLFGMYLSVSVAEIRSADRTPLPQGCDAHQQRLSPNGKYVAFVGAYRSLEDDEQQHGLFVVDLKSGHVRRLIDKALKTAPAWSPDSRKLAIGNSPGYGNVYPLAILDVNSGKIDDTGVQGVGAAWSPDGRWIAVTTQLHRGGTWRGGIPADGRIGVWDTEKRKLLYVSPSGYNIYDRQTGYSAKAGALRPVWSPDSQWIVFEQYTDERRGKLRSTTSETWVVGRDGKGLRKVFDSSRPMTWSDDSRFLVVEGSAPTEKVEVAKLAPVPKDKQIQPPADLLAAAQEATEAARRTKNFDAAPIFARNRPWQNPVLDSLKSVQFTHRMQPTRLDERFVWRNDGAAFVEVLHREDKDAEKEIGRLWVTAPGSVQYYFATDSLYPRCENKTPAEAAAYVRDHLMGTRVSFTALDWGRDPDRFSVDDVIRRPDHGEIVVQLTPRRGRDRYYVHAGAMFETTSWAYVHHLSVVRSEITIDVATHRILREVEYGRSGQKLCEVSLDDWRDVDGNTSVPMRIRLSFPNNAFHVDYRFQWRPEGLWILENGVSHFDGKEPQHEQVVDLKINEAVPDLEERMLRAEKAATVLHGKSQVDVGHRVLRMLPFELGKQFPLATDETNVSNAPVRSLLFTLNVPGTRYRQMAASPSLWADIELVRSPESQLDEKLLLALYDAEGRPLKTSPIPLAAPALAGRSSSDLLDHVRAHNAIWLAPDPARLPDVTYTFHSGSKVTECSLRDIKKPHFRRGVTMTLPLESYLENPADYGAPVLFEGRFNGRDVTVAVIAGPRFGWVFGNGIGGSWHGYVVGVNTQSLLMVDKDTGQPLASRFGQMEVRYLNYVEIAPGQYVPLRILVFRKDSVSFDFRFQVLENRVWLLDHAISKKGERVVWVDEVAINGTGPSDRNLATDEMLQTKVEPFDWASISDRRILRDEDNPLVQGVVAHRLPHEHPRFELLGQLSTGDGRHFSVELGRSRLLRHARHWTLTCVGPEERGHHLIDDQSAGARKVEVQTFPFRKDVPLVVHLPGNRMTDSGKSDESEKSKTQIRSIEFQTNNEGELAAKLESICEDHWKGFSATAVALLLDEADTPIAVADTSWPIWLHNEVYSNSDLFLNFGRLPSHQRPASVILGHGTVQIGAHMGSAFAAFADRTPLFTYEQMLNAEHPSVWSVSLHQLNNEIRREAMRRELFDDDVFRGRAPRQTRAKILLPHRGRLLALFQRAKDADVLSLLCRLAGHSGDKAFIEPMRPLLNHAHSDVRDGAAIGLGLLGEGACSERVSGILVDANADDVEARKKTDEWKTDAAVALRQIGTESCLRTIGKTLVKSVQEGDFSMAKEYAYLLGTTRQPLALEYFKQVLRQGDNGRELATDILRMARHVEDKQQQYEFFLEGIRLGNSVFLDRATVIPGLVPEVCQVVLRDDLGQSAFYYGMRYLQNSQDPKVLDCLREAFDRNLHKDYHAGRRQLAAALAKYGDYRGLDEVFGMLVDVHRAGPLPKDATERRREERRRDREKETIVEDILLKCFSQKSLQTLLTDRLQSKEMPVIAAALDVLQEEPYLGRSLRSQIENLTVHDDKQLAQQARQLLDRIAPP